MELGLPQFAVKQKGFMKEEEAKELVNRLQDLITQYHAAKCFGSRGDVGLSGLAERIYEAKDTIINELTDVPDRYVYTLCEHIYDGSECNTYTLAMFDSIPSAEEIKNAFMKYGYGRYTPIPGDTLDRLASNVNVADERYMIRIDNKVDLSLTYRRL